MNISKPTIIKTAQLVAQNKDTVLHLFNRYDKKEYRKILAPGFTRIQDYVDYLNEKPQYDFEIIGWEYRYYSEKQQQSLSQKIPSKYRRRV